MFLIDGVDVGRVVEEEGNDGRVVALDRHQQRRPRVHAGHIHLVKLAIYSLATETRPAEGRTDLKLIRMQRNEEGRASQTEERTGGMREESSIIVYYRSSPHLKTIW